MSELTLSRLAKEREEWRKDHPFGFIARPTKNRDDSLNLLIWDCVIPGRHETPWEKGWYHLRVFFSPYHPDKPPVCRFDPPLFHPNIFPSGVVCLPILDDNKDWKSDFTVKSILMDIQEMLHKPDIKNAVNSEASTIYTQDRMTYIRRIKNQARIMNSMD